MNCVFRDPVFQFLNFSIQLLCDQRSVHSRGCYCFKAAGNDLSSEGRDEDNNWVLWDVSESLGTSYTLNTCTFCVLNRDT